MPLTIERIKSHRIYNWKRLGIIDEDLSTLYDYLIKETNCMICFKEYKNSKDRQLDHDHDTGEIRYICCNNCNVNFLREKNRVYTKPTITNTSGHLNIYYKESEDKWVFSKNNNKKTIYKRFYTLAEAVQYKIDNNY